MKTRLRAAFLLLVGGIIGFALGRNTADKPTKYSTA
jgi:hypothetical protein